VTAHRIRIILGLAGLKVGELHGSLTQAQRLQSLTDFTKGDIDFLVCTDLAGRGLDIPGTTCVINMQMPNTLKQYIHRVGRTARAGASGRAITLVGEKERKLLREIVKSKNGNFKNRMVPQETVEKYSRKIEKMESAIKSVLKEEKEEAFLDRTEMELRKAENMIKFQSEITTRFVTVPPCCTSNLFQLRSCVFWFAAV
jgi:ATP-dependent RNA helicase DDX27